MKLLVISDIHGSCYYAKKIEQIYAQEKPDSMILLGDLYYQGMQSVLSEEYNPLQVSCILNKYKENILCAKGNCDSKFDEEVSAFSFHDKIEMKIMGKNFVFTHGHKYNLDHPIEEIDVLVYGHFHTHFIKKKENTLYINVGSISFPRNGTHHSYAVIDDDTIFLKDVDGEIIEKINIIG